MTSNIPQKPVNLEVTPLSALRDRTIQKLANGLDGIKIFLSEDGYARDFRGLAHFAGIDASKFYTSRTPTHDLIKMWMIQKENTCSLKKFQEFLGWMDRYDIYDDTNLMFLEDSKHFLENKEKEKVRESLEDQQMIEESNILTIDDTIGVKQFYDAFVLFDDSDIDFAFNLIETVEKAGFKLCAKERDLKGGTFEHEAMITLISERCSRLIVLVSPEFLENSNANKFFVNYAQALGIEQRKRKIIPCKIKKCILPPNLSYYFCLDYERSGKLYDFWKKLEDALKDPAIEGMPSKLKLTKSFDAQKEKQIEKKQEKFDALFNKNGIRRNSSDQKIQMVMPPPPKVREASSMFDLTNESTEVAIVTDQKVKKEKWFKKLLLKSSSSNTSKQIQEQDNTEPKKKKKKWFRKSKIALKAV